MNKRIVAKGIHSLFALVLASGVTFESQANIGIVSAGIAGGSAVSAGHPLHNSVVRIEFFAQERQRDGSMRRVQFSQCTGALVRNGKILTAGHCNEDIPMLSGLTGPTEAVAVFLNPLLPSVPLASIPLTDTVVPPNLSEDFVSKTDIRLYTLTQAPPASAVVLPIAGVDVPANVASLRREKEFIVAGFGLTEAGRPSPFLKMGVAFVPDWDQQLQELEDLKEIVERSLRDNKDYTEEPNVELTADLRAQMEDFLKDLPNMKNMIRFFKANTGSGFNQEPRPGLSLPGDSGGAILLPTNPEKTEFVIIAVTSAIGGTPNGRGGPILPIPQQLYGAPLIESTNSCFLQNQLGIPRVMRACVGPIR